MSFIIQTSDGRNRKCTIACSCCRILITSGDICYIKNNSDALVLFCQRCINVDDDYDYICVKKITVASQKN